MRLAAWNVARGLSNPEKHAQIEAGIEQLDADVVVLSESIDNSGNLVNTRFASQLGYEALTVPYRDSEVHPSGEQHITLLSRIALDASEVRLDTRSAIKAVMPGGEQDKPLHLFGAHFDDRSELARLRMAEAFLDIVSNGLPTVLAGDLNSMHFEDRIAKLLRSGTVRGLARIAPHPRIRSLGTRLTEMATGSTMGVLESAGFTDADPNHEPTMTKAGLKVSLDHFMLRGDIYAVDFTNQAVPGSDHRAIAITLQS